MTTAIVPMMGPMEFSARVEKRKAIEATTVMDQMAAMKARRILKGISDSGMKAISNLP
jgi:hypothetical protein